jgi:hypothetical protein
LCTEQEPWLDLQGPSAGTAAELGVDAPNSVALFNFDEKSRMTITAGVVLGTILGSMLDPLAIVICCGVGAWANRVLLSSAAGFIAYFPLGFIGLSMAGIQPPFLLLLIKSIAGALLGLIGLLVSRTFRKRKQK